jgi:hypothetical protein
MYKLAFFIIINLPVTLYCSSQESKEPHKKVTLNGIFKKSPRSHLQLVTSPYTKILMVAPQMNVGDLCRLLKSRYNRKDFTHFKLATWVKKAEAEECVELDNAIIVSSIKDVEKNGLKIIGIKRRNRVPLKELAITKNLQINTKKMEGIL